MAIEFEQYINELRIQRQDALLQYKHLLTTESEIAMDDTSPPLQYTELMRAILAKQKNTAFRMLAAWNISLNHQIVVLAEKERLISVMELALYNRWLGMMIVIDFCVKHQNFIGFLRKEHQITLSHCEVTLDDYNHSIIHCYSQDKKILQRLKKRAESLSVIDEHSGFYHLSLDELNLGVLLNHRYVLKFLLDYCQKSPFWFNLSEKLDTLLYKIRENSLLSISCNELLTAGALQTEPIFRFTRYLLNANHSLNEVVLDNALLNTKTFLAATRKHRSIKQVVINSQALYEEWGDIKFLKLFVGWLETLKQLETLTLTNVPCIIMISLLQQLEMLSQQKHFIEVTINGEFSEESTTILQTWIKNSDFCHDIVLPIYQPQEYVVLKELLLTRQTLSLLTIKTQKELIAHTKKTAILSKIFNKMTYEKLMVVPCKQIIITSPIDDYQLALIKTLLTSCAKIVALQISKSLNANEIVQILQQLLLYAKSTSLLSLDLNACTLNNKHLLLLSELVKQLSLTRLHLKAAQIYLDYYEPRTFPLFLEALNQSTLEHINLEGTGLYNSEEKLSNNLFVKLAQSNRILSIKGEFSEKIRFEIDKACCNNSQQKKSPQFFKEKKQHEPTSEYIEILEETPYFCHFL